MSHKLPWDFLHLDVCTEESHFLREACCQDETQDYQLTSLVHEKRPNSNRKGEQSNEEQRNWHQDKKCSSYYPHLKQTCWLSIKDHMRCSAGKEHSLSEDFSTKVPDQHAETMARKSWECHTTALGMCYWVRRRNERPVFLHKLSSCCTNISSRPTTTEVDKELNYNKSVQRGTRKTSYHRTPHLSYNSRTHSIDKLQGISTIDFWPQERGGGSVDAGGDLTIQK